MYLQLTYVNMEFFQIYKTTENEYFRSGLVFPSRGPQGSHHGRSEVVDPGQLEMASETQRLSCQPRARNGCEILRLGVERLPYLPPREQVPVHRHPMEAHRQEDRERLGKSGEALEQQPFRPGVLKAVIVDIQKWIRKCSNECKLLVN